MQDQRSEITMSPWPFFLLPNEYKAFTQYIKHMTCPTLMRLSYGTKSHGWSRDHGKNARPESTSCCLRAAVDRRSRQPEGSRRCSRAGIFARSPRAPCDFYIINLKFRFPTL